MNTAVTATLSTGEGLYSIDKELLKQLKPDVIVTQSLCNVCSVDLRLVEAVVQEMAAAPDTPGSGPAVQPKIISLNPFNIQVWGQTAGAQTTVSLHNVPHMAQPLDCESASHSRSTLPNACQPDKSQSLLHTAKATTCMSRRVVCCCRMCCMMHWWWVRPWACSSRPQQQ
jgi:hypothetical protein